MRFDVTQREVERASPSFLVPGSSSPNIEDVCDGLTVEAGFKRSSDLFILDSALAGTLIIGDATAFRGLDIGWSTPFIGFSVVIEDLLGLFVDLVI